MRGLHRRFYYAGQFLVDDQLLEAFLLILKALVFLLIYENVFRNFAKEKNTFFLRKIN